MKKNKQVFLSNGDKDILIASISAYKASLNTLSDMFNVSDEDVSSIKFDMISLEAFLSYDISVTLPIEVIDTFVHKHNVDFPEYSTQVKPIYPVNEVVDKIAEAKKILTEAGYEVSKLDSEKSFTIHHLPPTYESRITVVDMKHFSDDKGYSDTEVYDLKQMNVSDRIDFDGLIIFRTV